ncbi:hypothetical protein ACLOJK_014710 [Asimina triloba]
MVAGAPSEHRVGAPSSPKNPPRSTGAALPFPNQPQADEPPSILIDGIKQISTAKSSSSRLCTDPSVSAIRAHQWPT